MIGATSRVARRRAQLRVVAREVGMARRQGAMTRTTGARAVGTATAEDAAPSATDAGPGAAPPEQPPHAPGLDDAAALALAAAVAARLCHDLGGPLGGLAGALEVAAETPDARAEALEIATEGAAALARRLRLLRAAWAGCGPMRGPELQRLAEGLPPRVRLDLSGLGQAPLPAELARLALNLLLLGAEELPRGGTLLLSRDASGLQARLDAPGASWPALPGPAAWRDASPRTLQAPLTLMAAAAAGLRLVLGQPGVVLQCVENQGL